ncbi:parathyroid hormone 4 [Synchiropus picturatus]
MDLKQQLTQRHVQWLALMCLVFIATGHCQQSESRRAVAEHQLMHDRGRTIQSLKRLIWLSSAMEGLHTAQSRSAPSDFPKLPSMVLNPNLVQAVETPEPVQVQNLLRDFFYPHLTQDPES